MARLIVAVDGAVGVDPADVAAAWDRDDEARQAGLASVETTQPREFLGDVLALVVIPLSVNLASSAACALVSRLMTRLRAMRADPAAPQADLDDLEVVASASASGDLTVIVRMVGPQR